MANITSLAVGSTTVGANYNKAADPFAYGIREMLWIKVALSGIGTSPTAADSTYAKALRCLQAIGEVWYSATTASGIAIFAISAGTEETKQSDDALTNANAVATVKAAIETVTGGTATVTRGVSNVFQTS
jgi:hypothetical protein